MPLLELTMSGVNKNFSHNVPSFLVFRENYVVASFSFHCNSLLSVCILVEVQSS